MAAADHNETERLDSRQPAQDGRRGEPRRLRIAAFHVEPDAYRLVRDWAAAAGHEIVLLVTTPGPAPRTFLGFREIVASAPPAQDVLVTTKFKRAAPIVAAARPDVILSYTFPYRLPEALLQVAPLGAVNVHPSPLPRYRGPNPHRMIYDGEPTIGASLHRMAHGFDAGPLLSVQETPLPEDPTVKRVRQAYQRSILAALDAGMARVIGEDVGELQDEAKASYAASFEPDDFWLDWNRDARTLQRQTTALNLVEPRANAWIAGQSRRVLAVEPLRTGAFAVPQSADAGDVIAERGERLIVLADDGPVAVTVAAEIVPIETMDDERPALMAVPEVEPVPARAR